MHIAKQPDIVSYCVVDRERRLTRYVLELAHALLVNKRWEPLGKEVFECRRHGVHGDVQ